jgi:hypothetical protein
LSKFDMWVDNDVLNWFPTLKNFYRGTSLSTHISNCDDIGKCWYFAILWRPVEFVQCRNTIWDIIIYQHIKLLWYRTMLYFCDIVVAILKMAQHWTITTGRYFQNGHHNIAKIQHCPIS